MANSQKASDQQILDSYSRTKSVWRTGKDLGMCGQSIHERLERMGESTPPNLFSEEDRKRIERDYLIYRDAGRLNDLAKEIGRTKHFLCRQAKYLGLTDPKHPRYSTSKWKYMPEATARVLFEHFKSTSLGLGQYCKRYGYDDLGLSKTMKKYFPDEYECVIEAKAPRDTMYRLGRGFEYRIRDWLKSKGYFVLRSPQSKSPVDLIAIRTGVVLFIQCKRSGNMGSVQEWNDLYDLAQSVSAIPILAGNPIPKQPYIFKRMTAKKDGSRKAQPMEDYIP